ncbi:hypothetical protein SCALM49S_07794 [Streptomyces californicus]
MRWSRRSAPPNCSASKGAEVDIAGAMARRCGGFSIAASHCTIAWYEVPAMATFPSHQGCPAVHSTVSYPSRTLLRPVQRRPLALRGEPAPGVLHHRRVPPVHALRRGQGGEPQRGLAVRGVRKRTAGAGGPSAGRHTSARSTVPSRISTGTSCSTREWSCP